MVKCVVEAYRLYSVNVASGDQNNFKPWFEQNTVPCEGEVGDILVLTPLKERAADPEKLGSTSVWFCIKAQLGERPAVWTHVHFDGFATCKTGPLPTPSQTLPPLTRG
jgi:hypothetical protein